MILAAESSSSSFVDLTVHNYVWVAALAVIFVLAATLTLLPAVLAKLMPLIQKVAVAAKAAFNADGISVWQFNEPAGGQTVFHLHYHVIPRYDGLPLKSHARNMEDGAVLSANAEKLKAALGE